MSISNQIFQDIAEQDRIGGRVSLAKLFHAVENDAAICAAATAISVAAEGVPMHVGVGAAALYIVMLSEQLSCKDFDQKLAEKLRRVADLLDPQSQGDADVVNLNVRIGDQTRPMQGTVEGARQLAEVAARTGGIVQWFEQAVPAPTNRNRATQLGVHYEEVGEMMAALHEYPEFRKNIEHLATSYKMGDLPDNLEITDRQELLDSLCDQIVTAIGVGHMFGFDMDGALAEVNRSNWSKFVDGKPVFDANRKIAKGPGYFKPDLAKHLSKDSGK